MDTSCSPTCQQYPLVPISAAFHVLGRGAAADGQINFVNTAASRRPSENVKGRDFMFEKFNLSFSLKVKMYHKLYICGLKK
jgi:hypothetical protein